MRRGVRTTRTNGLSVVRPFVLAHHDGNRSSVEDARMTIDQSTSSKALRSKAL